MAAAKSCVEISDQRQGSDEQNSMSGIRVCPFGLGIHSIVDFTKPSIGFDFIACFA